MNKKVLGAITIGVFLAGCFGSESPTPPTPVIPEPEPIYVEPERPDFETQIDEDEAFNQALEAIEADEVPGFVEIIDEGNADEVVAAEPGTKLAMASEADKADQAESEARALAREQAAENENEPQGLTFREYSPALLTQVQGVRPALLYFTADECEVCADWEASLRAEAESLADKDVLVIMVDFDMDQDFAASLKVMEPGYGMILTGIGEMMGPRPSERLSAEELKFVFL